MTEPVAEQNFTPTYKFIAPHFYCDGVRVHPAQMTKEEIDRYIPREFREGFYRAIGYKEPEVKNGVQK